MRLAVIVLLAFSSTAFAWKTPDEVLQRFLAFELAGGRTQSWDFGKYFAVGEEYDEPGWDQVVIVQSYTVTPMACKVETCSSTVTFKLAKTPDLPSQPYKPKPEGGEERFVFHAVKTSDGWLLKPFGDYPHLDETAYATRWAHR